MSNLFLKINIQKSLKYRTYSYANIKKHDIINYNVKTNVKSKTKRIDYKMKTLTELRNEFIAHMNFYDYDNKMIYMLSHNVDTLLFIDYQITQQTEYATIESLFDDVGFHEFLQSQYESPITFDEMI